jgi:hypothetical protein
MVEKQDESPLALETKSSTVLNNKRHPFIKFAYQTAIQLFLIIIVGGSSLFLFSTIAGLSCKTERSVIILADFSNIVWFVASGVFPFVLVIITGKFKEGVLWCWFLGWSIMFYISGILPALLIAKQPELRHTIINSFPEVIGVTPIFVVGWLPALIWCGIAYGIHSSIKMSRNAKTDKNPVNPV